MLLWGLRFKVLCIDQLGHNWFVEADEEYGESNRPTDTCGGEVRRELGCSTGRVCAPTLNDCSLPVGP